MTEEEKVLSSSKGKAFSYNPLKHQFYLDYENQEDNTN